MGNVDDTHVISILYANYWNMVSIINSNTHFQTSQIPYLPNLMDLFTHVTICRNCYIYLFLDIIVLIIIIANYSFWNKYYMVSKNVRHEVVFGFKSKI